MHKLVMRFLQLQKVSILLYLIWKRSNNAYGQGQPVLQQRLHPSSRSGSLIFRENVTKFRILFEILYIFVYNPIKDTFLKLKQIPIKVKA